MIGSDLYHIVIDFTNTNFDYRFSNIEIIEIDINLDQTSMSSESKFSTRTIEPIKAKLIGDGVIRLFREFYDDDKEEEFQKSTQGDDTMLAILAIPTYFTATDLLGFIGESFISFISHIRILKSDKQNRFMVLIKFRDVLKAAQFKNQFDGKSFNSMEPESCHVVYVRSVQLNYPTEGEDELKSLIPFLLQDPFTSNVVADNLKNEALIELPTCPVCLEKMDSSMTGLLTIPCQHTFHCQCLSKWKDDSCPICRYSHKLTNLSIIKNQSNRFLNRRESINSSFEGIEHNNNTINEEENENCSECSENTNLWICLICGNVGCSRYAPQQHSLKHFVNTGHCFAMEISTSRVWDYAGDNYVHRLVTNESDGKLVELPDNEKSSKYSKFLNEDIDKVDAVGFEYSQLLISQLASQREYYEEIINNNYNIDGFNYFESNNNNNKSDINKNNILNQNNAKFTNLESRVEDLTNKLSDLTTSLIPSLKSKIQSKEEKLHKISIELNTQNLLNEAFSKKIEHLNLTIDEQRKQIEELKIENEGLKETNNDLMFYLDSSQKFENQPDDVKQGTVVIQQPPSSTSSSKKKKKKKSTATNS
ncbi:uncharacterized protein KGF55_003071 [Candida pseudojiufengensis]|uniref:uncharacterized protein n=1 Tax=Candida pseudojiufengensis TaxID=497109 RepID=UPI0022256698|nr:uncharacterized protein KGF55_003071 [Candida pseudojiufengensis]KAI5963279.1 hypothetical protein KGF55_003071 [Candida pseudojiufengensis]